MIRQAGEISQNHRKVRQEGGGFASKKIFWWCW